MGYVRKTKSSIQFDDFKRIILQLEKDGYLEKSNRLDGADCYFLLNKKKKLIERYPYLDWAIKAFIFAIITTAIGLLIALPKYHAACVVSNLHKLQPK
jgi:hypothetical protein